MQDRVHEALDPRNYLFMYSLGTVKNIKMHQGNLTDLSSSRSMSSHDYSSSEVPHDKPLAFTGMAQRKSRAAEQDKEHSLGRRQPQISAVSGSSSYLSLEGGKWRR